MAISKNVEEKMNEQISHEYGAMLIYQSMSSYFSREGYAGFSEYYATQAGEEKLHALKFVKFIGDAGGLVRIPAVPAPKQGWKSPEEAVSDALAHEKKVTGQVHSLVDLARKEHDLASENFLQWFVDEQVEEVSSQEQILQMLKKAGKGGEFQVQAFLKREG